MTPKAKDVFERVSALRQLESTAGLYTQRSQRALLLTLSDGELCDVSLALKQEADRKETLKAAMAPLGGSSKG